MGLMSIQTEDGESLFCESEWAQFDGPPPPCDLVNAY